MYIFGGTENYIMVAIPAAAPPAPPPMHTHTHTHAKHRHTHTHTHTHRHTHTHVHNTFAHLLCQMKSLYEPSIKPLRFTEHLLHASLTGGTLLQFLRPPSTPTTDTALSASTTGNTGGVAAPPRPALPTGNVTKSLTPHQN